ncbi:MAG: hypothetical protein J6N55_02680, partial [Anaerovibrio sp.]|nr:hypothetical protein [Anaerovibrio sp.]
MKARRTYKDSLFRDIFNDKKRLQGIYYALTGEKVAVKDIKITTLRGTFFEDIKPQIVVNDVYHLIGEGNSNIVFKHSKDSKIISFIFGINSTIEDLLDYYFVKLGKPKSLLNKNIQFLYNAKLIQSLDMKIKIKDF